MTHDERQRVESRLEQLAKDGYILFNPKDATALRALLAAAEAGERMMWQPIETAPKDGTRVLLMWRKAKHVSSGAFSASFERWYDEIADLYLEGDPARWMPLPDLPALLPAERHAKEGE